MWTKKDIKTLCGYLLGFYIEHRPISRGPDDEVVIDQIRGWIQTHRKEIVLAGIRSAKQVSAERYRQSCETIGNQIVRFAKNGAPDEIVERFTRFAREEDAAGKQLEALLHRVLAEALPPEVEAYDPTVTP